MRRTDEQMSRAAKWESLASDAGLREQELTDAWIERVRAADARVEALTKAITHVIRDSPGTPDSVKAFLSHALSSLPGQPAEWKHGTWYDRLAVAYREASPVPEEQPQ